MKGLLDTSVLIARAQGGELRELPDEAAVSTVTLAELHIGVLVADEPVRGARLRTLSEIEREFDALPVDHSVARHFAALVAEARREGRKPKIMDTFIAATAAAHDLPLYTRDADFEGMPDVRVVRV